MSLLLLLKNLRTQQNSSVNTLAVTTDIPASAHNILNSQASPEKILTTTGFSGRGFFNSPVPTQIILKGSEACHNKINSPAVAQQIIIQGSETSHNKLNSPTVLQTLSLIGAAGHLIANTKTKKNIFFTTLFEQATEGKTNLTSSLLLGAAGHIICNTQVGEKLLLVSSTVNRAKLRGQLTSENIILSASFNGQSRLAGKVLYCVPTTLHAGITKILNSPVNPLKIILGTATAGYIIANTQSEEKISFFLNAQARQKVSAKLSLHIPSLLTTNGKLLAASSTSFSILINQAVYFLDIEPIHFGDFIVGTDFSYILEV